MPGLKHGCNFFIQRSLLHYADPLHERRFLRYLASTLLLRDVASHVFYLTVIMAAFTLESTVTAPIVSLSCDE